MNKQGKKIIEKQIVELDAIKDVLEMENDNEQEKQDNTPDNLQESEAYQNREEIIDSLSNSISSIEEAIDYLQSILNQ